MGILLLTLVARADLGSRLAIDFSTDELFSITIDGTPWLHGAGAMAGKAVIKALTAEELTEQVSLLQR